MIRQVAKRIANIRFDCGEVTSVLKGDISYLLVRIKNKLLNRYYLYYNEVIARLTGR